MSVTYGFYNALNHDRRYDAIQMSQIFDGIINDGVYMSIGDQLMVKENDGMYVSVKSGRAWFNHTWTLNTTDYVLEVPRSEIMLDRIDAVVLEVDSREEVRANAIKIIKGTPSDNPQSPVYTNTDEVHQHPLAEIRVRAEVTRITQADITNKVGTSQTPFVTGIIETIDIDALVAQWQVQWNDWKDQHTEEFETWYDVHTKEFDEWTTTTKDEFIAWSDENKAAFVVWFETLHYILDGDVAGHLQNEIDDINFKIKDIEGIPIKFRVTVPENSETTITNGIDTFTHTESTFDQDIREYGLWTVSTTNGIQTVSQVINVDNAKLYDIYLSYYNGKIRVTYPRGAICTATNESTIITATDADGDSILNLPRGGIWTVKITQGGREATQNINIASETTYNVTLTFFESFINVKYPEGYSCSITGTKGNIYNAPDTNGIWTCIVNEPDTFTVRYYSGSDSVSTQIKVTADKQIVNINDTHRLFSNVSVSKSSFVSSSTYADYPYKADITLNGVNSSYVPIVNFSMADAISGNFAPIAESGTRKVTIYAIEIPSGTITIPSILCVKEVQ